MNEKNIKFERAPKTELPKMERINIGESEFEVSAKGGMITGWKHKDKDIIPELHQKENSTSLRGGVPICFPFFGPSPIGMESIPQHGWLRNEELSGKMVENYNPGDIKIDSDKKGALIEQIKNKTVIQFSKENEPTAEYPWKLKYTITHILTEDGMETVLEIERLNDGQEEDAPINPAFHPYFAIKQDGQTKIDGEEPNFSPNDYGIDITDDSDIVISTQGGLIKMQTEGFGKVWIWSDNPDKYACIEPVIQEPEKFNTPEGKFLKQREKIQVSMKLGIIK